MIVKNQNDIITILKIQMKNKGISNSELARRVGVSQSNIARVLNNNNHSIKLDTLFKYLDACNLSLDINIVSDNTSTDSKDN
jgi:transcriptional regulator with XRE-family HTH domain